jgi:hypothetical protein
VHYLLQRLYTFSLRLSQSSASQNKKLEENEFITMAMYSPLDQCPKVSEKDSSSDDGDFGEKDLFLGPSTHPTRQSRTPSNSYLWIAKKHRVMTLLNVALISMNLLLAAALTTLGTFSSTCVSDIMLNYSKTKRWLKMFTCFAYKNWKLINSFRPS